MRCVELSRGLLYAYGNTTDIERRTMDQNKTTPEDNTPNEHNSPEATSQAEKVSPAPSSDATVSQFANKPAVTVGSSQEKANKTALLFVVLVVALLGAGAAVVYQRFYKPNSSIASNSKPLDKAVSPPIPTYGSALVFQSSATDTASSITIASPSGEKMSTIASKPTDATFNSANDSSFNLQQLQGSTLITSDKAATSNFDVLTWDGKTQPVASSLAPLFNGSDLSIDQNDVMTIGKTTLVGINSKGLLTADLLTGKTTYLLTFTSPANLGASGVNERLVTMSRDGKTVYLFVDGVTVNGQIVKNTSLATLDITTGKFTVTALPTGVDQAMATVSNNGKLLAYQKMSDNKGNWATHLFTFSTGKDVTLPGNSVLFPGGYGNLGISFSPDDAYLSEVKDSDSGPGSANGTTSTDDLRIISVAKNTVEQEAKGSSANIVGYGWAGEHSLIYISQPNSHGANYGTIPMLAHSMDATTGKVFDFPQLGELDAVLNYQL